MQLVKYKWDTNRISGEPFLFAREGDTLLRIRLFDEKINMLVGKKRCTGYTKGGKHFECKNKRLVDREKMCRECAIDDDYFLCMKCTGEECINEPQRPACSANKYYIYLAAFSTMLKVGISYEARLLERLIEQGADMGAKIGVVQDGKLARLVEQQIGKELDICDRVSGAEKQKMLFGNPNVAAVNILDAFNKLKTNGVSQYLIPPEIYNLQGIYRLSSVMLMPQAFFIKEGSLLEGDIIAAKGNILVLKNQSGLFSVNAHSLIGCDVELN